MYRSPVACRRDRETPKPYIAAAKRVRRTVGVGCALVGGKVHVDVKVHADVREDVVGSGEEVE